MADPQMQSALREWRAHMGRGQTLAVLLGVGAVLGLSGPFGTGARLSLLAGLGYWITVVLGSYGIGALGAALIRPRLSPGPDRIGARLLRVTGLALPSTLGVALFVLGVNLAVFGWLPRGWALVEFSVTLLAITWIVTALIDLVPSSTQSAGPAQADPPDRPAILDRVPLEKRGALVALSAEDHYVRIMTDTGDTLVLMRLRDAIRETAPAAGGQVHRSHWAAWDQVTAVSRRGDGAMLTLTTGARLPVSRANMPRLRDAGLL